MITGSQSIAALSNYGNIDWSQGLCELFVLIKDEDGEAADARYGTQNGSLKRFYPLQVRHTAVLVPPAGSFPGWP